MPAKLTNHRFEVNKQFGIEYTIGTNDQFDIYDPESEEILCTYKADGGAITTDWMVLAQNSQKLQLNSNNDKLPSANNFKDNGLPYTITVSCVGGDNPQTTESQFTLELFESESANMKTVRKAVENVVSSVSGILTAVSI
jgi:hypothetical protein